MQSSNSTCAGFNRSYRSTNDSTSCCDGARDTPLGNSPTIERARTELRREIGELPHLHPGQGAVTRVEPDTTQPLVVVEADDDQTVDRLLAHELPQQRNRVVRALDLTLQHRHATPPQQQPTGEVARGSGTANPTPGV